MTVRLRAVRKLPCDPVAGARVAEPACLARGGIEFVAPPGAWAGLPAWRSRLSWLLGLRSHPELAEACAGVIRPSLFLSIMVELSRFAEPGTGRGIAVPHQRIAESCGVCTKTVQRAVRVAYRLGALHLVLAGTQMSLDQRGAVLDAYGRGVPSRRWRELPNFYAAVMPADAVARVAAVDGGGPRSGNCPPSGTGAPAGSRSSVSYEVSPFTRRCGQLSGPRAGPDRGEEQQRPRPAGAAHRQEQGGRAGPTLSPSLHAYAAALIARLPGYQHVSLGRIGPALSLYRDAGLSPADLTTGLDAYCRARRIAWMTSWAPEHRTEQARYLVGMLTRARLAGHLAPRS